MKGILQLHQSNIVNGIFASLMLLLISNIAVAQRDTANMPIIIDEAPRTVHSKPVAQIDNIMEVYEDSLIYYADSIAIALEEEERNQANLRLIKIMKGALKLPESYNHSFTRLGKRINVISPTDKSFKIINWEVPKQVGTSRYYAVIQFSNGQVYPLIDISDLIPRQQEDTVLTENRWFGALYYNIITQNVNGKPTYFMLGYNHSMYSSNKKIVECVQIDAKNNTVQFGAPVFNSLTRKNNKCKRFVLEYDQMSKVSLNYDATRQTIIYDHLESTTGDNAKRSTFVPDGTYDGLTWTGKEWRINTNIVNINTLKDGDQSIMQNNGAPPVKKVLNPQE
jgi:hypothetical protein